MKNIILILIGCFLFSCTIINDDSDSSTLKLTIPSREEINRAIEDIYVESVPYYARIYTLAYGTIYPIGDGEDYREVVLKDNQSSLELEDIPACSEYVLWIGIGTKKEENDAFDVKVYGESNPFELLSGNTVDVNIELKECPFAKAEDTLGYNISSVVRFNPGSGNNIYASKQKSLFRYDYDNITPNDFDYVDEIALYDQTQTINSLSNGIIFPVEDKIFVNTNIGIIPYDGSSATVNDPILNNELQPIPVLKSSAFEDSDGNVSIYFMRDGGFGGVFFDGGTEDWLDIDLSGVIKGQFALDLVATDKPLLLAGESNYGYFITKFGAFRLNENLVKNYRDIGTSNYTELAEFFAIRDLGKYVDIYSITYDRTTNLIFLGTEKGVWYGQINYIFGNLFAIQPQIIAETAEQSFQFIKMGPNYAIAATKNYLYVIQRGPPPLVEKIPFIAGIPGEITGMTAWAPGILLISGTEGLVAIDANTINFYD